MSEPSTDTRAALVEKCAEELRDFKYGEGNLYWHAERLADLLAARSAPVERGEGEALVRRAGDVYRAWHEGHAAGTDEAATGTVRLWQDSETRAWLYPDADLLASPPAPVERCGAVTTFGGAFPPMVCTLPMGHTGRHDADSAAPAPVEGTRERTVEEVTQVAFSAYTMGAAANGPDDAVVSLRRMARECADRILAAHPVQGAGVGERDGVALIAEERRRQVEKEGWTAQHDDLHDGNEMAHAARCYISAATRRSRYGIPHNSRAPMEWPWEDRFWKPSADPVRDLVKAGALIAAEIDRLQRAAAPAPSAPEEEPHG